MARTGSMLLLGHSYAVDQLWSHRLSGAKSTSLPTQSEFTRSAAGVPLTSGSYARCPTAFPSARSKSDREAVAPPVESCFLWPRGAHLAPSVLTRK